MKRSLFICCLVFLAPVYGGGQAVDQKAIDSLLDAYHQEIDTAHLRLLLPETLEPFFRQLASLPQSDQRKVVRIAHIGDSHIQADYLPNVLRQLFWRDFGQAGRGLVFPYQLAQTHGPLDYSWEGTPNWNVRRRTYQKSAPPIGISGMGLQATIPKVSLTLKLDQATLPFNRVQLFSNNNSQWALGLPDHHIPPLAPSTWTYHQVAAGETLYGLSKKFNCEVADLQRWNEISGHHIVSGQILRVQQHPLPQQESPTFPLSASQPEGTFLLEWPHPVHQISLYGIHNAGPFLFGMSLENTQQSGILYHMIGVNGTTYFHFNREDLFLEHLEALHPHLIIITLGTNEALQNQFQEAVVGREVRTFLRKLKKQLPKTSILIMTNPDAGNKRGELLEYPLRMSNLLRQIAREEKVALFDLYHLMGGQGGIYRWQSSELAYKDLIHFTQKGYTVTAGLLYNALMRAYHDRN